MSHAQVKHRALEEVVTEYLECLQAGKGPRREDYLARFPEHAEQLNEFFGASDVLDQELALARSSAVARRMRPRTASGDAATPAVLPKFTGFQILEELGSGGQGVVYKAIQLGTKRTVALKVLREGVFASRKERRRFEIEVELASRLQHPNIAAVFDCGEDDGHAYYAMQFVPGRGLDVYLASQSMEIREVLELFLQICDAIAYAHRQGVMHRDIKPSNMIVDDEGRVHIVDFGLAKSVRGSKASPATQVTEAGEFAGTWHYASPEQLRRDPALLDIRTDVYALGVILFELLTDCYPYELRDESPVTISDQVLHAEPISPSGIRREIDGDLEAVVLTALRKDPIQRYQSASDLADDVRNYLGGLPINARRNSALYVFRKALRRYRLFVGVAVVTLVGLIAIAAVMFYLYRDAAYSEATIQARMNIYLESEKYLLRKLDELSWVSNQWNTMSGGFGTDFQELTKRDALPALTPILESFEEIPQNLEEHIWSPDSNERGRAIQWLNENEQLLDTIVQLTEQADLFMDFGETLDGRTARDDSPMLLGKLGNASSALIARSVYEYQRSELATASRYLESARTLGVSLGNGRLMHQKTTSVVIRARIYDAVLQMMMDYSSDRDFEPLVKWAMTDPPLCVFRVCMISERQRLAQLVEEATFAGTEPDRAYLSIDVLDALTEGVYQESGLLTTDNYDLARSVEPEELLRLIDWFIAELTSWDSLTAEELIPRSAALADLKDSKGPWQLIRPLLPSITQAMWFRGSTRSKRRAMIISANLIQYRRRNGVWPAQLSDAIPPDSSDITRDPFLDRNFVYRLVDDAPLLYSVNEDLEDNSGKHGAWGTPGTDVVLFKASSGPN